jgi:hypothetical protein
MRSYVVLASLLLATANPAAAATIDTTGSDQGTISSFGIPDTATYGQTFTVTGAETYLEDFSLFLRNRTSGSTSLDLKGYIGTWTGTRLGTLLFSGASQTMNAAGTQQQFLFDTELQLAAGQQYVAFLSVSELDGQSQSQFGMPRSGDAIPGSFVFINNGADETKWTSADWQTTFAGANDVFFTATFVSTPSAAVPEPASVALIGLGFAAIAFAHRRSAR